MQVLHKRSTIIALLGVLFFLPCHTALAYNLGPLLCGGAFGAINLTFPKDLTPEALSKQLGRIAWSKKKFHDQYRNSGLITVDTGVRSAFKERNTQYRGSRDIAVPYGSEEFVAQSLVSSGIITVATHASGDCAGSDISYFWIDKVATATSLSKSDAFLSFFSDKLTAYASSGGTGGLAQLASHSISPIEPNYTTARFSIVAQSSVTRGETAAGEWDAFEAVVTLVKETPSQYALAVFAESIKSAPKSIFRSGPPSSEYFRPRGNNAYQDEYIVAAGISRFFAKRAGDCQVVGVAFDAKDQGPFRCTANWK